MVVHAPTMHLDFYGNEINMDPRVLQLAHEIAVIVGRNPALVELLKNYSIFLSPKETTARPKTSPAPSRPIGFVEADQMSQPKKHKGSMWE